MSKPWPPPPDLPSIEELMRAADPEGHLAEGAPTDEYEPEEEELFAAIKDLPTEELLVPTVLPILEGIWRRSFQLDDEGFAHRQPALLGLAKEIERFFGPESKPRTRAQILKDEQADKVSPA
jgi:hypothetical protein